MNKAADLAAEAGHFATTATNADLAGDHEQAEALREGLNAPLALGLSPQEIRMAALDMAVRCGIYDEVDILATANRFAAYIATGKRPA